MAGYPNKLIKFWQEVKRRKVFKVIAMFAGAAFILLQLAEILAPALLLPARTTRLITLILIIGFPFAIILSWIFNITPEGLNKTETVEAAKKRITQQVPVKRRIKAIDIILAAMAVIILVLLLKDKNAFS